ncbi:hypothetical protein TNCV_1025681 [Trichonephila clavipes]|nr:hypothetical protein TNCV_1025681 [Trichonephila clavipes]
MATLLVPSVPGMSFSILAMGQERGVCCHQISELDCPLVPQIGKLSTWAWIGRNTISFSDWTGVSGGISSRGR